MAPTDVLLSYKQKISLIDRTKTCETVAKGSVGNVALKGYAVKSKANLFLVK